MMCNYEMLKITGAEYVGNFGLCLTFSNGERRLCDFAPISQKEICKKLQDIEYFKNFRLDPFSVDWNNEVGFAPEFLYAHSTPQ